MTDAPKAILPSHDFKLVALFPFATSRPNIPPVAMSLGPVCQAFGDNLNRVRSILLMLSMSIHFSVLIERFNAIAELELTGKVDKQILDTNRVSPEMARRVRELYADYAVAESVLDGTDEQEARTRKWLADAMNRLSMISGSPAPYNVSGINGLLSSLVLAMWTTFETMAGDLWEASLNAHAPKLADLSGYARRITKGQKNPQPTDGNQQTTRQVPLSELQRHRYDVKDKMGTILRSKFNFDSLDGIREAYAVAFSENYDNLDEELKNKSFDSLSVLRNVFVHKAGIADEEYRRKAAALNLLPNVAVGQPIILDGLLVSRLIEAAEMSAIEILRIVAQWITKH